MLPVPIRDHLPKVLTEEGGDLLDAFCDKVDSILTSLGEDALGLSDLRDPASAPAQFLEALGQMYAARLLPFDSEAVKRSKVANAVKSHKDRGLWTSVKAIIDFVVVPFGSPGAEIFSPTDESAIWLLRSGLSSEPGGYMASMGCDGSDLLLGIFLAGEGSEYEIKGNVWIDVGLSTLTADQVEKIVASIEHEVPAYFRVRLGYVSAGLFVTYSGGVIG